MHYRFVPGLVRAPKPYRDKGIVPKGGLSATDVEWVRRFYPPIPDELPVLEPAVVAALPHTSGAQVDFALKPKGTRKYKVRTIGACDTLMAVFERVGDTYRYVTAEDDAGEDRNGELDVRLFADRSYVLRVRMKYTDSAAPPAVLMS